MKEAPTLHSESDYATERRMQSLSKTLELTIELLHVEDITAFL
jgi:hypothetical protein